eukprot:762847-Hanusia_phi.AAC.1
MIGPYDHPGPGASIMIISDPVQPGAVPAICRSARARLTELSQTRPSTVRSDSRAGAPARRCHGPARTPAPGSRRPGPAGRGPGSAADRPGVVPSPSDGPYGPVGPIRSGPPGGRRARGPYGLGPVGQVRAGGRGPGTVRIGPGSL